LTDKLLNPELASRLDDPERLKWLPPGEVLEAISVERGDVVADVGAGTGYFSFPLAEAVGPAGRVYAIDADGDQTGLPERSCNLVFLGNVWHEFADRNAVLREASRILHRPGRVAILDWRPDVERVAGPPLEQRIDPDDASAELAAAGFEQITRRNIGRYSWLVQGTVRPS
jgi:ubiquinone/menaquinone biosynthesis C-methylase UbiE